MNFRPADMVMHPIFGTGRVVRQEDMHVLCDFPKLEGSEGGREAWVMVERLTRVRT